MSITFVGSSKEERNRARATAVRYLIGHPEVKAITVHRRKFNYHKGVDEYVVAGTVLRMKDGKFYWSSLDDKSSPTYINRDGESTDPVWWYQVKRSINGETIKSEKTLTEARSYAVRILIVENGKYLYIRKGDYETPGLVSKGKDGGFVWITYKNPRNPVAFGDQYVLKTDGSLGRKL